MKRHRAASPTPTPPTATSLISVQNLRVERGDDTILGGVSWDVNAGEHWVMLGPNGSGKTSLLCALTGYLPPTAGEIAVLGRTYGASDWRDLRRHIGMVSANLRQRIEDTESAREVVASGRHAMLNFWGRLTAADKAEAARLLESVGLAGLARRAWGVLSQGERQRVLIARALAVKPQLLILDEPCAGLDPVARETFLDFVQRLGDQPDCPTLVLVTHHVEEIVPLFTHALLLRQGGVVAQGPVGRALTGARLTESFGHPVRLVRRNGRYSLSVAPVTSAHIC